MEFHSNFIAEEGQTLNVRGDDDIWAFIDKKLVINLEALLGIRDRPRFCVFPLRPQNGNAQLLHKYKHLSFAKYARYIEWN